MPHFLDRLVVSPLSDGYTWFLDHDFRYGSEPGSAATIAVPKGFETDFASIPSLLAAILPKWSTYGPAAIVHDWLYWEQTIPRAQADGVFLKAMIGLDVGRVRRLVLYLGVRWFGWWAWKENAGLKRHGVTRMRPPGAAWPAYPTWHRFRFFPRAALARRRKEARGP